MKDIIISVDSTSHKVNFPDEFLGIGYENLQGNLIFQFDNNFIGGEARLEVSIDEESGIIPSLTHYENGYIVPIKSSLLTGTNVLMQLVIDETSLTKYTLTTDTQVNHNKTYYEKVGNDYLPVENPNAHDLPTYYEANTPVFKTDIFSLKVKDSINAQETIPEQYPTWINTFNILVATLNQKLLLVDQALTEMDNLNISVSNKVNGEVTITFTDKEGNVKVVKINDGRGIVSITKTSTSGNVDTYTITYTNNTTSTFQVTNGIDGTDGVGIESIYLTGTSGLTDTYTILYTDGTTTEFQVKNGKGITKIEKISTNLLVDTYKITFNDGTTQNYEITNGKGIVSIEKTSTDGLTDIYTITYNDNTTTTFNVVNGKGIVSIEKTSTSGYVDTYTITYNDGTTTTYEVTNGEVSQAQLNALQDELNYYKTIVNALPKITGSGTSITLNNTANSILSNILNPNIYQETTNGNNILPQNIETQTLNGVTLTANSDGTYTLNGTASANTNFVFPYSKYINFSAGTYYVSCNTYTNITLAAYYNISDLAFWKTSNGTFTLNDDASQFRLVIVVANGGSFNNVVIKPMINTGSTAKEWEKYTGGISAPNPSYPMPIHSVSGDNTIKERNINWFNGEMEVGKYNDTTGAKQTDNNMARNVDPVYVLPSTQYIISNNGTAVAMNVFEYKKNGTFIQKNTYSAGTPFTTTSETAYINFYKGTANTDKLQIELGDSVSPYTPYNGDDYIINLGNIEYCKIGNYADRFFKNVVDDIDYSDTLILGAWYIKKKIGKVVLDGNTSIEYVPEYIAIGRFTINYYYGIAGSVSQPGAMSTHFKSAFSTNDGDIFVSAVDNRINVINKAYINNVNGFKEWLGINTPIVYYIQLTPTYTQITGTLETQLEAFYNQALAYKGQTNISQINNDLPFIIDSIALKDLTNL